MHYWVTVVLMVTIVSKRLFFIMWSTFKNFFIICCISPRESTCPIWKVENDLAMPPIDPRRSTHCCHFVLFQLIVNETMSHPLDPDFIQCVDYRIQTNHFIAWNLWHIFVTLYTYVCPLVVIVSCYSVICYTIYSKGKKFCGKLLDNQNCTVIQKTKRKNKQTNKQKTVLHFKSGHIKLVRLVLLFLKHVIYSVLSTCKAETLFKMEVISILTFN